MPLTLQFISKTTTEQEPTNRPTNKQTNERNREYNKQTKTPITTRIPSLYFNGCAIKTTHHILTILCIYIVQCRMYMYGIVCCCCLFGADLAREVVQMFCGCGRLREAYIFEIYIYRYLYMVCLIPKISFVDAYRVACALVSLLSRDYYVTNVSTFTLENMHAHLTFYTEIYST